MDSLTQIALGAAVGQAVLGRKVGYRAALWGGVCGTLPDLDILIPMGGAVADFTYHRSFSHSLLILPILVPLLVWLILKVHPQTARYRRGWFWLVLLALITHPLLDAFTVYGTQLLWPISEHPFALGSIFIIDPLYTLPLLLGVVFALIAGEKSRGSYNWSMLGLILSTLYLGWGVMAQQHVASVARASLDRPDQPASLLVTPAPFNTLLWRVVAMRPTGYREGYYSLLDRYPRVQFDDYSSRTDLLSGLETHWPVERLQWFSKGFYKVHTIGDEIVMSDLRMGAEPDYVFNFRVATVSNPHPEPTTDKRLPAQRNWDRLPGLLKRIWSDSFLVD